MMSLNKSCFFALGLVISGDVLAGGPLAVEGSNGHIPVHYSPATVTLNFDIGTLGTRTNAQTDALVIQALSLWNNVATSSLKLQQGNDLSADVDINNYLDFIPDGSANHPANSDGLNPVVYDDDGSIIDDMFGLGSRDTIAGFAASIYYVTGNNYVEGYAVLNGNLALNDSELVNLVAHEMGHFVGLDHSQLDIDNSETDSGSPQVCSTKTQDKYPLMYPFSCRRFISLHEDDIASVSALYPAADITASFGQVNGVFVDTSGNPVLGANLWLSNTLTGQTYSIVSDYLLQNTGYFSIYLPAGNYTLHANSINPIFFGASSVGPYAYTQTDPSFKSPHPLTAVTFEGDTPGMAQTITIEVGKGTHVRFVTDGSGETSAGTIINSLAPKSSSSSGVFSFQAVLVILLGLILLRGKRSYRAGN